MKVENKKATILVASLGHNRRKRKGTERKIVLWPGLKVRETNGIV